MKWATAILMILVVLVGLYVSLNWGSIEPAQQEAADSTPAVDTPAGSRTYADPESRYTIAYPQTYKAEAYTYQALGPSRQIHGQRFVVPASMTEGANLSSDTYISVEPLMGAINSCSAGIYLESPVHEGFVDAGGHRYSVASSMGAAAGNRYEEVVYATPIDGGCLAVRYFIHYGAIQNYPQGAVREFDKQALLMQFDTIRASLVIK